MTTPQLEFPNVTNELVKVPSTKRLRLLGLSFEISAVRTVLLAYLVTRLLVMLIILLSSTAIPMRAGNFLYSNPDNLVLDGLVRDDSWWYTNIATRGYSMGNIKTGEQGNAAFFPFYPLLIKMVAGLTGNAFIAGILVSNIAFLIALSYLYGLVRHEFGEATASRAVFYFAAAPTALFFSAMYTESTYMLLVIATFYYARLGQWDRAALTGALASATRNTGVLMALVVALEGMHQQGVHFWPGLANFKRPLLLAHLRRQARLALRGWRSLLGAAFVPLGLIGYMAYLSNTFGDPLGFIHVQATWGREVSGTGFMRIFSDTATSLGAGPRFWAGQFNPNTLLNIFFTLGFGALVIICLFKLRPTYSLYAALTFFVPLSTGSVGSMTRYVLMLLPCFILLARWGQKEWVDRLILGVFLPLLGYFTIIFSHWYFAG